MMQLLTISPILLLSIVSSTLAFPSAFVSPRFLLDDLPMFQSPFSRNDFIPPFSTKEIIPPFYLKKILDNYRPPLPPVAFVIIEDSSHIGEGETRDVKFPTASTVPSEEETLEEFDSSKDIDRDPLDNAVIPPRTLEFPFLARFLERLEHTSTLAPETSESSTPSIPEVKSGITLK